MSHDAFSFTRCFEQKKKVHCLPSCWTIVTCDVGFLALTVSSLPHNFNPHTNFIFWHYSFQIATRGCRMLRLAARKVLMRRYGITSRDGSQLLASPRPRMHKSFRDRRVCIWQCKILSTWFVHYYTASVQSEASTVHCVNFCRLCRSRLLQLNHRWVLYIFLHFHSNLGRL